MSRGGVLVLCTHNSGRSQMAEAFLRRALGDRMPVYSAGTEPASAVHPLAVQVMAEAGCDLSTHRPKHYRELLGKVPVHTLVIVCERAAANCPTTWPGALRRIHSPFVDPAEIAASAAERVTAFRDVRHAIEVATRSWVGDLERLRVIS
jgi:arsenate reductase (thioredoxin)